MVRIIADDGCEGVSVLAAAQIFAFASALDIPCIVGSQAELAIGTAAAAHLGVAVAAHLGVAVADLPYPCETFGPLRYERDIVTAGATIERGLLRPADRPGLGVEVDWETVRAWMVELWFRALCRRPNILTGRAIALSCRPSTSESSQGGRDR